MLKRALTALGCVLAIAVPAVAAHAQDAPYADWNPGFIGFASTTQPDATADCADGSRACIDRTTSEMYRRFHRVVPVCDHNAVFSLAYIRVTENVIQSVEAGEWPDGDWLQRFDALFARLYFTSYSNFLAGRRDLLPPAWRIAYDAGRNKTVSGYGNFLLSMNGHIQRDMAFALYHTGLVGRRTGQDQYGPFTAYNKRLRGLYQPVLKEFSHRFDATIDNIDVLPGIAADDDALLQLLYGWREVSWRNAQRLAAARSDAERRVVAQDIETYAEGWANLLQSINAYRFADDPGRLEREVRCAKYGGQDPSWREVGGVPKASRFVTATKRGVARVRLSCGREARCSGVLAIRHGRRTIGRYAFALNAATKHVARVALSRAARRLLARGASLRVRLVVSADPAPGRPRARTAVRRATLRPAPRSR